MRMLIVSEHWFQSERIDRGFITQAAWRSDWENEGIVSIKSRFFFLTEWHFDEVIRIMCSFLLPLIDALIVQDGLTLPGDESKSETAEFAMSITFTRLSLSFPLCWWTQRTLTNVSFSPGSASISSRCNRPNITVGLLSLSPLSSSHWLIRCVRLLVKTSCSPFRFFVDNVCLGRLDDRISNKHAFVCSFAIEKRWKCRCIDQCSSPDSPSRRSIQHALYLLTMTKNNDSVAMCVRE